MKETKKTSAAIMDMKAAAEYTGLPARHIRHLIRAHLFPGEKKHGRYYTTRAALFEHRYLICSLNYPGYTCELWKDSKLYVHD